MPQTPGQWEEEQIWLEGCMAVAFPLGLHPNPHTGLGLGCLAGRESMGPGQGELVCVPLSGEWSSTCTCVTLGYLPQRGDNSVPSLTPCDVRVPFASAHSRQTSCPGCAAPEPPLADGSAGWQRLAHSREGAPSWQQPLCTVVTLPIAGSLPGGQDLLGGWPGEGMSGVGSLWSVVIVGIGSPAL